MSPGVYSEHGVPYAAYRPASRTGTPRSERDYAYPTYEQRQGQADVESVYEERDISMMYARPSAWNTGASGAGPSSPLPARSSYSSPPPQRHRASLEVGGFYASPRSPAPSSAPPAYPPYGEAEFYSHDDVPGAFPATHSEPAPDDYYWYAGAPPSISSSHTRYGQAPPSQRSSAPPGAYSREDVPGFFGVRAPHHHPGHRHSSPRNGEQLPNFPQWSRTWYDGHLSANGHAYTNMPPPSGESGWESETLTRSGGVPGSYGHVYGARAVNDVVKEERIRMLEKQFGKPKVSHKGGAADGDEDEEEEQVDDDRIDDADLPFGAVNSRGKLVTERPKWKLAIRWLIGLAAVACFATGIGGALLIKPGREAPASRGSIASYILYGCSAITLVVLLYLYVIRPCCCDPIRKDLKGTGGADNPLAGMVIPVLSGAGGPGGKMKNRGGPFGGKGKKNAMMMAQQAPTVNLIVDPSLLGMGGGGGRRGKKGADDDDESDDERLPGDARRSSRRKNGVGVLGNMQMQRRWMLARKTLKVETTWDAILFVIWIACVVVALAFGKKCPPGGGNGWCNYYNAAIACGAILAALLLFVLYLDYRDLTVSKKAPKPPL